LNPSPLSATHKTTREISLNFLFNLRCLISSRQRLESFARSRETV
jgi:hypothetical protein